ncbi:MAG: hypothetical protein HYV07_00810 [Deltaproteobacteria bacterium]|nr:hypothetical protein [Deltaproteobacteria bacterium]
MRASLGSWALGLVLSARVALADDAGAAPDTTFDPRVAQIHALIDGELDLSVDPVSLFDVPIGDEDAVRVESVRVRALLHALDASASEPKAPASRTSTLAPAGPIDPERWKARVALDRARLEFYSLSSEQRWALLEAYAARVEAARPKETDAERRAREARVEHERALEAARVARSESERLVAQELARLLGIRRTVEVSRARFIDVKEQLAARSDALLGWQRRARGARSSTQADAIYDALRHTLRGSRDQLDTAIHDLDTAVSELPAIGPDPLLEIPPDIPSDEARAKRTELEGLLAAATREERTLHEARADLLLNEVNTLNRERIALLPRLSEAKRSDVTGLTLAGLDQARAEARHLLLILRYHRYAAGRWLSTLEDTQGLDAAGVWAFARAAFRWLVAIVAFAWWRRRSPALLALVDERLAEADRADRRAMASPRRNALRLLTGVHRSLEWIIFFAAAVWLLPEGARVLLETQIVIVIVEWSLVAMLVVNGTNTLASGATIGPRVESDLPRLRLRSLRLVGRVVVAFGLMLVLSERLVGEGTIYAWASSLVWVPALPVFFVLVSWWRSTVFERVERVRKKSALQSWILANRAGWKSFFAASIAAVQIFTAGAAKALRGRLSGFDLARRVHAYLFKRKLDRLAGNEDALEARPLAALPLAVLAPDRPAETWIACPADEPLASLERRAVARRGGVVGVVSGRGLGKSTLLSKLAQRVPDTAQVRCTVETSVRSISATLEVARASDQSLVLLDDADAIVRPVLGGLRAFDELLMHARARGSEATWVFAIDDVVWPFLRRARDARPLFDEVITLEPWTDRQIGELLTLRTDEAGIQPTFEGLLDQLPASADEIDRQEALAARRAGYFRMVWDYARGNPAIALEAWRSSLSEDEPGQVRVRSLRVPDPSQIEDLPDSALFILRAVLQMAPASVADVAQATRLNEAQIRDAFRYGQARGHLVETEGRVRISWTWLRAILLLLERRHLLVSS